MMTLQFMMLFDVNDAKRVLTSIINNKIRSFHFLLHHSEALLYPQVHPKKKDIVSVYRFPGKDDGRERERWLEAIPISLRKTEITDDSVVCSRHWPEGADTVKYFEKDRPANPPTIFNGVEKVLPPLRTTTMSLAEARRPLHHIIQRSGNDAEGF